MIQEETVAVCVCSRALVCGRADGGNVCRGREEGAEGRMRMRVALRENGIAGGGVGACWGGLRGAFVQ